MAAATIDPPAQSAPPTGVNIIDSGPPKPPPAPTSTIRVSQMTSASDPGPLDKPKAGMSRLQSDLRKKAGISEPETPKPAPQKASAPTTAEATLTDQAAEQESSPSAATPTDTQTKPVTTPTTAEDKAKAGKTNPWKLVDEFKGRAATLEKELAEVRKSIVPEHDRKALESRAQTAEARLKELEDEIRYVNYQKHPDFVKNYQQPYENAWKVATAELSEISIVDPTSQQQRPATPEDLMQLVNLPLGQARAIADQVFGPFADDVMAHRKEIRTLFEKQSQALKEAKEAGSLREQQQREQQEKTQSELSGQIRELWERSNNQLLEDPQIGSFFKPREGDSDWNERLTKGFQLVDQAFSQNPTDPKLSPEQRAQVVRRHAAVRNRAAGWGAVKYENTKLRAQVEELTKELSQYKESTPPAQGTTSSATQAGPASAKDSVFGALRKLAGQ